MMTRFRTIQAAPAMQIPVFMILMTAPVYVPRAMIEGWVAMATRYNPFTAIVESGRSLMAGDPFHVVLAFTAAAGLAAAMVIFARRGGARPRRPSPDRRAGPAVRRGLGRSTSARPPARFVPLTARSVAVRTAGRRCCRRTT